MSATPIAAVGRPRTSDPAWRATAIAGAAQVGGVALALATRSLLVVGAALALTGAGVAVYVLAPRVIVALRDDPALIVAALLFALAVAAGVFRVLTFALIPLAVAGGVVLISDALGARLGAARSRHAPWRVMTDERAPRSVIPWGALAGVLLVGWAAFLVIAAAGPWVAGDDLQEVMLLVLVAGGLAVVIGTPLLVAFLARARSDETVEARDNERQRVAAHLHDSVLQTLAQRQAHDPTAVARLARRQEYALRAWMAGESELFGDTLVAALRAVVDEVEDEHAIAIELTAIGDRSLDAAGEALVAAAREALRNAARHAGGAPVVVFAELSPQRVEVFVRDDGVGFDPDGVEPGRRGIRDAIVGRMAVAGGQATVESAPGEGTEVALRLGGDSDRGAAR
jgi:signal transduction histidine kinase